MKSVPFFLKGALSASYDRDKWHRLPFHPFLTCDNPKQTNQTRLIQSTAIEPRVRNLIILHTNCTSHFHWSKAKLGEAISAHCVHVLRKGMTFDPTDHPTCCHGAALPGPAVVRRAEFVQVTALTASASLWDSDLPGKINTGGSAAAFCCTMGRGRRCTEPCLLQSKPRWDQKTSAGLWSRRRFSGRPVFFGNCSTKPFPVFPPKSRSQIFYYIILTFHINSQIKTILSKKPV